MIPLQLPTAPEMIVILLIFLILFGIPAGAVYLLRKRTRRTTELQERVEELEADRQGHA